MHVTVTVCFAEYILSEEIKQKWICMFKSVTHLGHKIVPQVPMKREGSKYTTGYA